MRIKYADQSIPARPWVRRWMVVSTLFLMFLPGYLWSAFAWAAEEAREYADQFRFKEDLS